MVILCLCSLQAELCFIFPINSLFLSPIFFLHIPNFQAQVILLLMNRICIMFVKKFDLKDHKLHVISLSANTGMQLSPAWNRAVAWRYIGDWKWKSKSLQLKVIVSVSARQKCNYLFRL